MNCVYIVLFGHNRNNYNMFQDGWKVITRNQTPLGAMYFSLNVTISATDSCTDDNICKILGDHKILLTFLK